MHNITHNPRAYHFQIDVSFKYIQLDLNIFVIDFRVQTTIEGGKTMKENLYENFVMMCGTTSMLFANL